MTAQGATDHIIPAVRSAGSANSGSRLCGLRDAVTDTLSSAERNMPKFGELQNAGKSYSDINSLGLAILAPRARPLLPHFPLRPAFASLPCDVCVILVMYVPFVRSVVVLDY